MVCASKEVSSHWIVPVNFYLSSGNHGDPQPSRGIVNRREVFTKRFVFEELDVAQMVGDDEEVIAVVSGDYGALQVDRFSLL